MKILLQSILTAVFTAVMAFSTFASEAPAGSNEALFTVTEPVSMRVFGNIPASVLDPNFREWLPPQPVPMIPANINDVMMTDGMQIYFNPLIVNQLPRKINAFILAHEYGHIYGRTSDEAQSDRFAAQVYARTDIGVVKAAVWHMHNMQGNQCSPAHGCGWQRAINIAVAAGFSEEDFRAIIRGEF